MSAPRERVTHGVRFLLVVASALGAVILLGAELAGAEAAAYRPIHDVQGSGTRSPLEGSTVTTRGVVTATRHNGFFLQAPGSEHDGDPSTSEGIFVYTGGAPPATALVGTLLEVRGLVAEYVPSADPVSPPLTEISGSPTVMVLESGVALPAAVVLATADINPAGDLEQLERFEGMRVAVTSLTVVGPTQGSVSEQHATATSNGVFYGVISGLPRPFREAGIAAPEPLPLPGIPRFDANPERLRVDSDALGGSRALEVTAGATVSGLVGPLDYAYRSYTILPEPASAPTVAGLAEAQAARLPVANEITVASWNLQRFFDDRDDPVDGSVLTPAAFAHRLGKASLAVREVLRCPDILAVQEVESLVTLEALASRIDAEAAAAGAALPGYQGFLVEGNDPSGIDVGFLVRRGRVEVARVEQVGKDARLTFDGKVLNDRPPLVLEASARPTLSPPFTLTVIVNHLRSLIDIDDPSAGARVRAKRAEQAEFLARLVQARQQSNPAERILVVGDFNAFVVSDGYVDVLGTVIGDPTPAGQVLVASADLVEPDLVNLGSLVAAGDAYDFVASGNAQALSHVLATGNVVPLVTRMEHVHLAADFPESTRNEPARPERLSDHDAIVVYLAAPDTLPARPPRRRLGR